MADIHVIGVVNIAQKDVVNLGPVTINMPESKDSERKDTISTTAIQEAEVIPNEADLFAYISPKARSLGQAQAIHEALRQAAFVNAETFAEAISSLEKEDMLTCKYVNNADLFREAKRCFTVNFTHDRLRRYRAVV